MSDRMKNNIGIGIIGFGLGSLASIWGIPLWQTLILVLVPYLYALVSEDLWGS